MILIGLALSLGVIAAFWALGVFGTLFKEPDNLLIYPNATMKPVPGGWSLTVTIFNRGSHDVVITGIRVERADCQVSGVTIQPATVKTISCTASYPFSPYTRYTIKIYTDRGYVFTAKALSLPS